ncbi:hypothetical protein HMPREF1531_00022 [Propionibacterium sp. oral taxon 192 str. F0372]|nr:hypothetical protein HMPREF1531_00022 [Propionibacterium sp. oral taxon 192 str. F0372]
MGCSINDLMCFRSDVGTGFTITTPPVTAFAARIASASSRALSFSWSTELLQRGVPLGLQALKAFGNADAAKLLEFQCLQRSSRVEVLIGLQSLLLKLAKNLIVLVALLANCVRPFGLRCLDL